MWPFKSKKNTPADQVGIPKLYAPYYRLAEVTNRELYDKVCEMFRTMEPDFERMYDAVGVGIRGYRVFRFPSDGHCVTVRVDSNRFQGGATVYFYTVEASGRTSVRFCREIYEGLSSHEPTDVSELHDLVSNRESEYLKCEDSKSAAKAMAAVNEALGRR